ncbi:MAG: hypothetical protein U1C33_05670, partial [Candidatus Cloacimonadaceae bacterium]|nr:hypothetical protein [Candidatus Cloacimonadaceae bacterium]
MFDFQKPKHWLLLILGLHAFIEFYKYSTFVLNFSMVITLASVLTAYIIYPNTHLVGRHNIKPLIFLVFWMAYNAFTFIWAEDKLAVIDHYQILARYFIIFWIYSVVFTKDHIRRHLQWFFAFVMLVYVLTSLWEIGTMNHLPSSRFYGIKFFIPTGPFF